MTTTDTATAGSGENAASGSRQGAWLDSTGVPSVPRRGRRRLPYLLVGLLLVVSCVGGAVWWTHSAQERVRALALVRPVTVGQVLTEADVRGVDIALPAGVELVPADRASAVLGRPMATSLEPGALLTPDAVGGAAIPAAGRAVVAVGVQPGQFPPAIAAGTPVTVIVAADTATNTATGTTQTTSQGPGTSWRATVVDVAPAASDQTTVVSLELAVASAAELAQVPSGQLSLVMRSTGGGR